MKKLFIFDFDGTLFDTVCDVVICFNRALTIHDFPTLTFDEYIERLGGNIDEIVSLILNENNTPENIELIKKTYGKCYAKSQKDNSIPFEGVREFLIKLQDSNKYIAINSNRTTDSIKYFVNKSLSDIDFIQIEGYNPDYPSKPNPYGVERIIKNAGVTKDETVYIGDSKTDIKTAKNAGIDCVIVRWGYGNQNVYGDEYILKSIENVGELLEFI